MMYPDMIFYIRHRQNSHIIWTIPTSNTTNTSWTTTLPSQYIMTTKKRGSQVDKQVLL